MSEPPCASVVIPCLNEVRHIGPCLDALDAQQGLTHPVEVFVVDGGSEDEPAMCCLNALVDAPW